MKSPLAQSFRHRENQDGSWDSICMRCYLTAAHSYGEQPLTAVESGHHCDESSWLFKESYTLPMASRTPQTVRLEWPGRACLPSAMSRFPRQPETVQSGQQALARRHAGWAAGLWEQSPSETSSGL